LEGDEEKPPWETKDMRNVTPPSTSLGWQAPVGSVGTIVLKHRGKNIPTQTRRSRLLRPCKANDSTTSLGSQLLEAAPPRIRKKIISNRTSCIGNEKNSRKDRQAPVGSSGTKVQMHRGKNIPSWTRWSWLL